MKKHIHLLLFCVLFISTVYAQKTNIPGAVIKAFAIKFPGATNIKWGKENAKEYEAEFKLNNTPISANFGLDGTWTETETTIDAGQLPGTVTNAVNTKYPGAVIFLTERIEKPGNKIFYEVNIKVKGKKKELELDDQGSFIE